MWSRQTGREKVGSSYKTDLFLSIFLCFPAYMQMLILPPKKHDAKDPNTRKRHIAFNSNEKQGKFKLRVRLRVLSPSHTVHPKALVCGILMKCSAQSFEWNPNVAFLHTAPVLQSRLPPHSPTPFPHPQHSLQSDFPSPFPHPRHSLQPNYPSSSVKVEWLGECSFTFLMSWLHYLM